MERNYADTAASKRLLSLDFMRGLIMVLLMLESTRLYDHLDEASTGTYWNGGSVSSCIIHGTVCISGIWSSPALCSWPGFPWPFLCRNKNLMVNAWSSSFRKILKRCGWLFFWGVMDYAVQPRGLSLNLTDVLTQLSFTTPGCFFDIPMECSCADYSLRRAVAAYGIFIPVSPISRDMTSPLSTSIILETILTGC